MINCIVVDDEKPARDELKFLLDNHKDFKVIGEAENGVEALNLILTLEPEVVFCDISMPLLDGIELAKKILSKKIDTYIVYVTAYDEYAIKAFELNAVDYLLKPLKEERFLTSLSKLKGLKEQKKLNMNKVDKFLSEFSLSQERKSHLCLYKDGVLFPVKSEDIVCIYIEDKTVKIVTSDKEFECYKSLSEIEQILPEDEFLKCHRSYIINLNYIESIIPWFNRTYRVKLKGFNKEIPVSRNQTAELKNRMQIL
ncbi:LytR/AlgR family response regulator transcription factor [Maledivibacter halophilus]|uniref:Stage 0 sporulation protein A homolog n=1 Tax=Maledivibacter halophilus TaxID=36842 RepID=A0A1T5KPQ8_9FIRM|nr:LytTR family DNA-binding domain-containing protein [Maledivibacter halophilus]SKC65278.1 two component transcriptional regulator, LytTR family [Maledivibacter halophilus]